MIMPCDYGINKEVSQKRNDWAKDKIRSIKKL